MNSLRTESLERLQDAGFLVGSDEPDEDEADIGGNITQETTAHSESRVQPNLGREVRGVPWFEEMVEGSDLGRIKRRRGGQISMDGRSKYEWEVVEIGGEEDENTVAGTAKRKLGAIGADEDVHMRSG